MKWTKASERFPDDWEGKHWRYVEDHYKLDTDLFEHRDNMLCKKGGFRGGLSYNEIEWLDESPQHPEQGELRKELKNFLQVYWSLYANSGKSYDEIIDEYLASQPPPPLPVEQDELWREVGKQLFGFNYDGFEIGAMVELKSKYLLIKK